METAFMKTKPTILFLLILNLCILSKLESQELYRISNTHNIIRFYKSSTSNIEFLTDSVSVDIKRQDSTFTLSFYNKQGKAITSCLYKFKGRFATIVLTNRSSGFKKDGMVKKKQKVKVLEPIESDCINEVL
jgi:hypothetical protein